MDKTLKVVILVVEKSVAEEQVINKIVTSVSELPGKWISIIESKEISSLNLLGQDISRDKDLLLKIIKDKSERLLNKKNNLVIALQEPTHEELSYLVDSINYLSEVHIAELGFESSYLSTVNESIKEENKLKAFYGKWTTNKVLAAKEESPYLVIFDIDNTLAYSPHRHPFRCSDSEILADLPILPCIEILKLFIEKPNKYKVVFLTGRNEKFKDVTIRWLIKQLAVFREDISLYMRGDKDFRPDYIIKYEMLNKIKKDFEVYNLLCVFDDRKSVVEYFQQKDIYVFDVGQGKNSY